LAKTIPKKKHKPQISPKPYAQERLFSEKPVAKAKGKRKLTKAKPRELRKRGWMVAGIDTSMSSLAGAAIGWDETLKKLRGPVFTEIRWSKEDHYYDRIKTAAKSHEIVLALMHELGIGLNPDEVWIAQEEPWPAGMAGKRGGVSAFLKQQAEISGAFLGGLVRYGYTQVTQMNSMRWRQIIAQDLGITTHHSKWRSPELVTHYNCTLQNSGKFRTKEWAIGIGGGDTSFITEAGFPNEIPEWEDLIESTKLGKVPRPEGSNARAVQPDDRYDALAIMWAHYVELQEEGAFDEIS
jgi:hypothetical protein